MRVNLVTAAIALTLTVVAGYFIGSKDLLSQLQRPANQAAAVQQVDSIFLSLDYDSVKVPVERSGTGGALTSIGDALVVLTHEGGFFDVTGDEAIRLDITPPPNGWNAMLDFEAANPAYRFAHYGFRYNDVDTYGDELVISYTEWVEDGPCYRTNIAAAPMSGAPQSTDIAISESDWRIVFSTEPCLSPKLISDALAGHMAGSRFRIDPEGTIILASGDYAFDGYFSPLAVSQNPAYQYGKTIAIDLETGANNILTQGHSNMQGIVIDDGGDIYTVEHGRRGGDELNRIEPGLDYGYPSVSLGTRYNGLPLPGIIAYGRHPIYEPPVYSWLPSIAVSSLMQIDGFHPAWDGDLLAGSLSGRTLLRMRMRDDRVLFAERIRMGMRIRYVHQHGDKIALWTDHKAVVRLSVGELGLSARFVAANISRMDLSGQQKAQVQTVIDQCSQCHSLGVLSGGNAPALGQTFGRDIASGPEFSYSVALNGVNGRWTEDALAAYLADPEAFASGTTMPNPQINDPVIMNAVIDVLKSLSLGAR